MGKTILYATARENVRNSIEIDTHDGAWLRDNTLTTSTGIGNRIIIKSGAKLGTSGRPKCEFLGNNNQIVLEPDAVVERGHYRLDGDGMTITFGEKTTVNGAYILCMEGASVRIGKDCMLSYNIEIRTSDAHSIIETTSGTRVNLAKEIVIGDHVWVGKGACILPGVRITDDVIIGTRAVVAKSVVASRVVVAGVPARIVAENRTWTRDLR